SKPAVGAAGAGISFDVGGGAPAYVDVGATVNTNRRLFVTAHDETKMTAIARSGAANGAAGVGLAFVHPDVSRTVAAYVSGTVNAALGTGLGTLPQGVFIDASAHDNLLGFATGRATAREVGLTGSAVILRMDESNVDAYVGPGANITATNAAAS